MLLNCRPRSLPVLYTEPCLAGTLRRQRYSSTALVTPTVQRVVTIRSTLSPSLAVRSCIQGQERLVPNDDSNLYVLVLQ